MPETRLGAALATDVKGTIVDYSVTPEITDGTGNQKESTWVTDSWNENLGYYKNIPELKTAIDTKATWTIGAGIEADEQTELILGTIKGNGKDTFSSILKNQIKVKTIDGDSYAEIIRDKEGFLLNIKPLAPDSIRSVWNAKGMIKRYEQINKVDMKAERKFNPEQILHLSRERLADEIHGVSVVPAVKQIILARNEAMADWKRVLHRNVDPLFVFHLDTDDASEIAAFKTKHDAARKNGENLYVPKGVVEPELIATATNASLNPLAWINQLNDYFFQAVNVPQIIVGNSKEFTDASGKIVYLSYEQAVKAEQLYVEEQILSQLNLEIKLTFPASLQNEAISDTPSEMDTVEEEPMEEATQPNDTTEELEGKK
jgi:hypothetical protein